MARSRTPGTPTALARTALSTLRYSITTALLLLLLAVGSPPPVGAKKLPDIHWNSSNPIFDISNTDHVKSVRILDRVTIVCPRPPAPTVGNDPLTALRPAEEDTYEYSKLFMVSREGYDKCELREEKQLGICATPDQQSSISLVFRDFSPLPSAMEFHPGSSYYVITTSTGMRSGLNFTRGGLCASRNMKMKFDVAPTSSNTPNRHGDDESHHPLTASEGGVTATTTTRGTRVEESIMYVIHTSEPETVESSSSAATGQQPLYLPSKDEVSEMQGDGSGASVRQSSLILICCSLLLLRLLVVWRR